ncbi:MAG TPA: phosphoenolpyruvate-protein phosphotransferase, partial [Thioalkalivibrio sp.]|nr:phosphoenolpyruvate-protein phosphotransferase [Thioalkalivibrio sp.]
MIHSEVDIVGMPYVPGFATGRLQAGGRAGAGDLALIGQDDIARVATPPAGFIVVEGAPFSHTLITLLGWGVPTVLVSAMQAAELTEGMALHLDGLSGRISSMRPAAWPPTPAQDLQTGRPLHMADGEPVHLLASVRTPEAARHAAQGGASAIGLVRSEFLVPADGAIPDATFYRREIRALCEAAAPLPVTLRLLDLAMDKLPPWLPRQAALGQSLGLQGVRLYPTSPVREVVEAQL